MSTPISEEQTWAENINLIGVGDPVTGGVGGIANDAHIALANRSQVLKANSDNNSANITSIQESLTTLTDTVNELESEVGAVPTANNMRRAYLI